MRGGRLWLCGLFVGSESLEDGDSMVQVVQQLILVVVWRVRQVLILDVVLLGWVRFLGRPSTCSLHIAFL
jgi:hypothetical protein